VAAGGCWFEEELAIGWSQAKPNLTPRETQFIELVSQGLTNKEIGLALQISESAVRTHCATLFRKLGMKDRYELAIYGMKNLSHRQNGLRDGSESHAPAPQTPVPQNLRVMGLEKPAARTVPSMSGTAQNTSLPRKVSR
jgi:DNA-binding CsgD family transcriptional regulator